MEWQTEAIDTDAHPLSQSAATLVKEPEAVEPPETAESTESAEAPADGLEVLTEALAATTDLSPTKAATLRAILKNVRESIDNALKLLDDAAPAMPTASTTESPAFSPVFRMPDERDAEERSAQPADASDERVVEGVFDGMGMVGGDGKSYSIPPNYASKSKLVEGDMLKLTIGGRGNFIYKQIGPIERQRLIGTLAYDQETGQYLIVAGGRSWKVLKASITYYKAEAGDEAVILAPKNAPSKWAAVENIIRKTQNGSQTI